MIPNKDTGGEHPVHPVILSKTSRLPADRMNRIHRMTSIVLRSLQASTCGADGSWGNRVSARASGPMEV